ncbi:peptide-methionine (S)-S-oxide reductase MsrA [bacterium]|nr:peptide-methionine (S)-S-oxide reductase MsrA [bacterium]
MAACSRVITAAVVCVVAVGCSSSTPDSESLAPPAATASVDGTADVDGAADSERTASSEDRSASTTEAAPSKASSGSQTVTLGAGCFWCVEAVFERIEGVSAVRSGYSGGDVENPTYKEVCEGMTGHAEVVQLDYDPAVTSFEEILQIFFTSHDPTTLNRQGADEGTQYRSAIFYHTDEQKQVAGKIIAELNQSGAFPNPIVTEVTPFRNFYEAEGYHQDYFELNGRAPYCRLVIVPKVEKVKQVFAEKLKPSAKAE